MNTPSGVLLTFLPGSHWFCHATNLKTRTVIIHFFLHLHILTQMVSFISHDFTWEEDFYELTETTDIKQPSVNHWYCLWLLEMTQYSINIQHNIDWSLDLSLSDLCGIAGAESYMRLKTVRGALHIVKTKNIATPSDVMSWENFFNCHHFCKRLVQIILH